MSGLQSWFANPLGSLMSLGAGDGGTIWNNGTKYQVASAGEEANKQAFTGMDPNGLVAGLYNDLTGVTAQSREFAQQEYLQDKQNEWNREENRMQRMKEAGINANLAAAGIAGQGGTMAAQPAAVPSNAGGVASGLSAAAAAGQAGSTAALNKANANYLDAQARNVDRLADAEILGKVQPLAEAFEKLGIPAVKASLGALGIASAGIDGIMAFLDTDNVIREYDYNIQMIKQEIDNEEARWQEIQSNITKNYAAADQATQDALLAQAKAEHEKVLKDLSERERDILDGLKADPRWNQWQTGWFIYQNYGIDSPEYANFMEMQEDYAYYQYHGQFSADKNTIKSRTEQENEANLQFQKRLQVVLADHDFRMNLYNAMQELFGSGTANPQALIRMVINLFMSYGAEAM